MFKSSFFLTLIVVLLLGCGRSQPDYKTASDRTANNRFSTPQQRRLTPYGRTIELPKVDQKPGTAVVLLVDTSGSMKAAVKDASGGKKPKHEIASAVIEQVVDTTDAYLQKHPVLHLEFGIFSFSSSVNECLKIDKFDRQKAQIGIDCVPPPNGGTAIGRALVAGFQALYSTGCVRKYLVCVTDGENTSGPDPQRIAQQLFDQTRGDVEIHFVAFDINSAKFSFLDDVNGFVAEAADGQQLSERLTEIYEKRILVEMPAEASDDK